MEVLRWEHGVGVPGPGSDPILDFNVLFHIHDDNVVFQFEPAAGVESDFVVGSEFDGLGMVSTFEFAFNNSGAREDPEFIVSQLDDDFHLGGDGEAAGTLGFDGIAPKHGPQTGGVEVFLDD